MVYDKDIYSKLVKTVLNKLYAHGCWNKGHLLVERLQSGVPSHLKGEVRYVVGDLIKQDLIRVYGRTKHGLALQLNIKRKKDIEELIGIDKL